MKTVNNSSLRMLFVVVHDELINDWGPCAVINKVNDLSFGLINQFVEHIPCVLCHCLHILFFSLNELGPVVQELASATEQWLPHSECCFCLEIFEALIAGEVESELVHLFVLVIVLQLLI